MNKKLLLTGFEPFGGETVNPSGEVVSMMPDYIGGIQIIKKILPVHFSKSKTELEKAMELHAPDAVISLGQAGGRRTINIEKVALNIAAGKTYDGESFDGSAISPEACAAYFSTLPVSRMTKKMNESGIPCEISYFAGTYVCNFVFFTALNKSKNTGVKCGFIHLPYSLEQGVFKSVPTMAVRDMSAGIESAISVVFDSDTDDLADIDVKYN